jgi:uncharacterized membrane protein YadS
MLNLAETRRSASEFGMAALGLGVDVRTVAKAGPRVTAAVVLSLGALTVICYAPIDLVEVR